VNPNDGCSKGHSRCLKSCCHPEKCQTCPYLVHCCERYCISLPLKSLNEPGREKETHLEAIEETIDFIVKQFSPPENPNKEGGTMETNPAETGKEHQVISASEDRYEDIEKLKRLISKGKYRLDCGHHVTLNHNLGNNIAILNGKELKIICTLCLY